MHPCVFYTETRMKHFCPLRRSQNAAWLVASQPVISQMCNPVQKRLRLLIKRQPSDTHTHTRGRAVCQYLEKGGSIWALLHLFSVLAARQMSHGLTGHHAQT